MRQEIRFLKTISRHIGRSSVLDHTFESLPAIRVLPLGIAPKQLVLRELALVQDSNAR
jgi:hypothetical protein